jgi:hypothetical protein
MGLSLTERLTFDRLFRISEPKRVYRSFTVRGPPLEVDSYQDVVYYIFNFKANPSTTGLRHHGYVKFFKPKNKNPKNVPLQHLDCLVDCTCPDFRYRWAWANKQRQSSVVGPNSLNQAWNKAPRKTNPKGTPGLCKHILATRSLIYGLLSSFPGDEPDTAHKLDRLTKYATKRWTDFEGQMRAARAKEAVIRRRRELRNIGQLPVAPPAAPAPVRRGPQAVGVNEPTGKPADKKAKATTDLKKAKPDPLPLALPPGQRGRQLPTATPTSAMPLAVPPGQRGRQLPTASTPASKPKRVIGNRSVNPPKPGAQGWIRPEESHLCAPLRDLILESVVKMNGESMSNIKEAIKLVEEMEADELSHLQSEAPPTDMGLGSDIGGDTLEPSEPPMSDSAIGADTEGESALSLLRSMKNSLDQIAAAVAPVEAMPGEGDLEGMGGGGGGGGMPPGVEGGGGGGGEEGEGEFPMPDEPPGDLEDESGEEGPEGGEEKGEAKDDDDDDDAKGKEKADA